MNSYGGRDGPEEQGVRPVRACDEGAMRAVLVPFANPSCGRIIQVGLAHGSQEGGTMALLTVEGIYKEGKVELTERPTGIDESTRVLVTFLRSNGTATPPSAAEARERAKLRQQAFARMKEG